MHPSLYRPHSRREFVVAAAATVAGLAATRRARADSAAPRYRSRPDLVPPRVAVTTPASDAAPGYLFVAPFGGSAAQQGPLIVDDRGEPVWFRPVDGGQAQNFRVQKLHGKPVLTWWQGVVSDDGTWQGVCFIADETYRVIATLHGGALKPEIHEFVITSRDSALVSMNNVVSADLTAYGGPADGTVIESVFQEIDIDSGNVLLEWHSLDHVTLDESYFPAAATWDYFHLNSVGVAQDGNLIVSARYPSAVYKLDRTTGEVIWRLGGKLSDFAMGTGTTFAFQHDARNHPGGLLSVFDDGAYSADTAIETASRGLLLAVDETAKTCALALELPNPSGVLTTAMGDVQQLDDGGFMVGWGTNPVCTEFDSQGGVRFAVEFADGGFNYRAFRHTWTGTPLVAPAIAAERGVGGTLDVYASWNGATDVTHWRVVGGAVHGDPSGLKTAARTGFETQIRLADRPSFVAVEALDASGRTLGRSPELQT